MVGAMSITYTKPLRRLVADRSKLGCHARRADAGDREARAAPGDAGLTTNTASCAGSTSASMRPDQLVDAVQRGLLLRTRPGRR